MPLFDDAAKDAALQNLIDRIDRMYLCDAEPTTFLEASATFRLGVKTNPALTGPVDGATDGRRFEVDTFVDGVVEVTGDATHYALVDEANTALLVVAALSTAPEAVVILDSWTVSSPINVTLRDPA